MYMTRELIRTSPYQWCSRVTIRIEMQFDSFYQIKKLGKKVYINGIKYPRRYGKFYKTLDNLKALRRALKELGNPMMYKRGES